MQIKKFLIYIKKTKIYNKLKKSFTKYFKKFPIQKFEVSNAIIDKKQNLKKIVKIIHLEVRKKMDIFIKRNRKKKFVILDIPLLLENRINKKNDILIFVQSNKSNVLNRLTKEKILIKKSI